MRKHTGERPVACTLCSCKFTLFLLRHLHKQGFVRDCHPHGCYERVNGSTVKHTYSRGAHYFTWVAFAHTHTLLTILSQLPPCRSMLEHVGPAQTSWCTRSRDHSKIPPHHECPDIIHCAFKICRHNLVSPALRTLHRPSPLHLSLSLSLRSLFFLSTKLERAGYTRRRHRLTRTLCGAVGVLLVLLLLDINHITDFRKFCTVPSMGHSEYTGHCMTPRTDGTYRDHDGVVSTSVSEGANRCLGVVIADVDSRSMDTIRDISTPKAESYLMLASSYFGSVGTIAIITLK